MPRCLNCKTKFTPTQFLQKHCDSEECKDAKIKWAIDKVKSNREKQNKVEKAVLKDKLKTLSEWKSDLQIVINGIVREIDKGHPCIATGATTGKRNAGHYISIGSNETLRFHLENIWIQSEHSNMWKSGDTLRYQDGIVSLYGKEYLESLNSLKSIPTIKLSIEDIKDKLPIARSILKHLKLEDKLYSKSERLELRKKFNLMLGIYK